MNELLIVFAALIGVGAVIILVSSIRKFGSKKPKETQYDRYNPFSDMP